MKKAILFCLIITGMSFSANAQRYLTEVFTDVDVTTNVAYGDNYSVLTGSPLLQSLVMDVYEPTGDTEPARPLLLVMHTGSFLPIYINQLATGHKGDSATVAIAERFARMGYVVAVPSYRAGWNPQGTQDERTQTIIQAVFRAIQDARTCVRWFRMNADVGGNTYAIDPTKVAIGGQGSGAYISNGAATLDKNVELQLTKFFNFTTNAFMVDTTVLGDWNGIGGNPALNVSNHVGYSSEIDVAFSIAGANGDTSWIDADSKPIIYIQGIADAFSPYSCGIVTVPGTTLFVVDVCGASPTIRIANELGINDPFKTPALTDPYTMRANALNAQYDATYGNDGDEGLFTLEGAANGNGPWEFWDDATATAGATAFGQDPAVILANTYAGNPVYQALGPVAGKARAMAYIDTICSYAAPRMYRILFDSTNSVNEVSLDQQIQLYPNPSNGTFNVITANNNTIDGIEIYTNEGRLVKAEQNLNTWLYSFNQEDLPKGFYLVRVRTENGMTTKKLIVQ